MPPRLKQFGFTLAELLVTISIVAILVVLAVPAMQDTVDRKRLQGAAEQLLATLELARSEAMKTGTGVTVSFTTGANACFGLASAACDCNTANSCILNGQEKVVRFSNVALPQATFGGGATVSYSGSRGMAAPAGTVWLRNGTGLQVAVVVSRLGRMRMCSPNFGVYPSTNCPAPPP